MMTLVTTTKRELTEQLAAFWKLRDEEGEHSPLEDAAVKLIETTEAELINEGLLDAHPR